MIKEGKKNEEWRNEGMKNEGMKMKKRQDCRFLMIIGFIWKMRELVD